jgi:hypothetical protein
MLTVWQGIGGCDYCMDARVYKRPLRRLGVAAVCNFIEAHLCYVQRSQIDLQLIHLPGSCTVVAEALAAWQWAGQEWGELACWQLCAWLCYEICSQMAVPLCCWPTVPIVCKQPWVHWNLHHQTRRDGPRTALPSSAVLSVRASLVL